MSYPLRTAAAVTALGLAGAAVWAFSSGNDEADRGAVALGRIANVALTTNHDCADLLDYYRTQATKVVGPYGVTGGPQLYAMNDMRTATGKVAPSAAGGAAESGAAPPDSTTNVQVSGVDESDIVKTKGDLMVSVINGEIRITRLAGAETKTLATWRPAAGAAQSVLLDGDTAVVIGDQNGGIPLGAMKMRVPSPDYYAPVTQLTLLDLSDPANPRPVRRLDLGGNRNGEARLVDGELRVAVTAGPTGLAWVQPEWPNDQNLSPAKAQAKFEESEKKATAANKKLITKSKISDWIPQAKVTPLDAAGKPNGPVVDQPLLDCEQVAIPASFSGLSTLALVSTDLQAETPLTTWQAAGVIAEGSTLYATADHAWLATSRWDAVPTDGPVSIMGRFAPSAASTQIHRFDTPLREQPAYIASGEIPGTLLNQFAMDEKDGMLRVASTTDSTGGEVFPIEDGIGGAAGTSVSPDAGGTGGDTAVSSDGAAGDGVAGGSTGSDGKTVVEPATPAAGAVTPSAASEPGSTGAAEPAPDATPATGAAVPPVSAVAPSPVPSLDQLPVPSPPAKPKEQVTPKPSESRVTVLKVDGQRLTQVGMVDGLGKGERIRGVRFIGDVGYVVTYRQTDPLYTVDLSDPAKPAVRGELAVLGYSAYLHPAGDGRLLGLGQDGTKEGRSTALQLSLFDVSNLQSPTRLDRERLAEAWSDAENDHHAFTMAGDLVLIPYNAWTSVPPKGVTPENAKLQGTYINRFDAGVIAVRVSADGLGTPSTLRPIATGPITFDGSGVISPSVQRITESTPMRTVVHDGTIYTLTTNGVAAHSATSLSHLTFAKF